MLLVFPVVAARLTHLKAKQQRCASVDCLSSPCASFILQSCLSPFPFVFSPSVGIHSSEVIFLLHLLCGLTCTCI